MRSTIYLGLAVVGMLVVVAASSDTRSVHAQVASPDPHEQMGNSSFMSALYSPMLVSFTDDPLRHHGMQIRSYFKTVGAAWSVLDTVPATKKFIITDIHVNDDVLITLASDTDTKLAKLFDSVRGYSANFRSGIVFEPSEALMVQTDNLTKVLITGYLVDL